MTRLPSPTEVIDLGNQLMVKYDLPETAIELLKITMLPKAMRPPRARIMARLGLSEAMYDAITNSPKFNSARLEFIKQFYFDWVPDVMLAMKDEALAGNERAAKLFLEFVGAIKDDAEKQAPFQRPISLPDGEINIVINQLTQKFYGDQSREIRPIEEAPRPDL